MNTSCLPRWLALQPFIQNSIESLRRTINALVFSMCFTCRYARTHHSNYAHVIGSVTLVWKVFHFCVYDINTFRNTRTHTLTLKYPLEIENKYDSAQFVVFTRVRKDSVMMSGVLFSRASTIHINRNLKIHSCEFVFVVIMYISNLVTSNTSNRKFEL